MFCLSNICSLCLIHSKSLKNIASNDNDGIIVKEKLKVFLLELVIFKPDIPKYVCKNCLENLNYIYKFRIKCLENITSLNNYLQKVILDDPHKQISIDLPHLKSEEHYSETNEETPYFPYENIVLKSEPVEDESGKNNFIEEQNQRNLLSKDVLGKESFETKGSHLSLVEHVQEYNFQDNCSVKKKHENVLHHFQTSESNEDMYIEEDSNMNIATPSNIVNTNEVRNQNVNNGELYKCKDCDAVFEHSSNLKKHKQIHTESRPYKCPICHKRFQLLNHLKTHRRTHTGEKPFSCDVCEKTFSNIGNLQKHQRIHTNERPYQCTLCDKSFKQSIHLIHHKVTHTGEKPFHCHLCQFKCSIDSSLKRHMRIHASDNNIPAPAAHISVEQTHTNVEEHQNRHESNVGTCDSIVLKSELDIDKTENNNVSEENNKITLLEDIVIENKTENEHVHENLPEDNIALKKEYENALTYSQTCESYQEFTQQIHIEEDNNKNKTSSNTTTSSKKESHSRTQEKPFTCDVCSKTFNNPSNLQKHQRIHTNERPYKCTLCDRSFTQSITLTHHLRTHTGEKPFHCVLCKYKTARESSLKRHILRVHTNSKPQQNTSQPDHTAAYESYLPCDMNSATNFTEERNQTNLLVHNVTQKDYDINVGTENSSNEHVQQNFLQVNITVKKEHENALNNSQTCEAFGKFNEEAQIEEDKNIASTNITTSTSRRNINEAVNSETQVAHTVFPQERDVEKQKQILAANRPYKCPICHKGFQRSTHLKIHALTHTGDKPYKCNLCNRTFGNVSNYLKHQRTHTNDRPFQCSFCEKTFAQSINLIHHQRTHTGEKPFHCQLCQYKTARESSLKRHMLTHTGDKPYQCSICQHKCTQLCHLKEHMLTHSTVNKSDTFILGV